MKDTAQIPLRMIVQSLLHGGMQAIMPLPISQTLHDTVNIDWLMRIYNCINTIVGSVLHSIEILASVITTGSGGRSMSRVSTFRE
jgi:hypothetical protein